METINYFLIDAFDSLDNQTNKLVNHIRFDVIAENEEEAIEKAKKITTEQRLNYNIIAISERLKKDES